MMEDEEFRRGDISIQWLEARLSHLSALTPPPHDVRVAVLAAALTADRDRSVARPRADAPTAAAVGSDRWTQSARVSGLRPA